jgi:hypothetical protein
MALIFLTVSLSMTPLAASVQNKLHYMRTLQRAIVQHTHMHMVSALGQMGMVISHSINIKDWFLPGLHLQDIENGELLLD